MLQTINFIGAGKLGKTLARLIHLQQAGTIQAIVNTTLASAHSAIDFIGAGTAYASIADLPSADITLITVQDQQIEACSAQLANNKNLSEYSIVAHCSGSVSSNILQVLKNKNLFIASVHPMFSFAIPEESVNNFSGAYCAIEGDPAAETLLIPLFKTIGANLFSIDSANKSLYHTAGAFCANFLVALSACAQDCLQKAGITKDIAKKINVSLMQSALNNIEQANDLSQALTGPIQRGDIDSVKKHLAAIENPDILKAYQALGCITLQLTDLPAERKTAIYQLLKH